MLKLFITDVDGTMTDGRFTIDEFGNETKTFNVKDGTAMILLRNRGVKTAIITGHNSKIVENRSKQLGIDYYIVSTNKIENVEMLIRELHISYSDVAYIGDDLNDILVFEKVGHKGCPMDACKEIRLLSNYICSVGGGYGAIREYVDYLIGNHMI